MPLSAPAPAIGDRRRAVRRHAGGCDSPADSSRRSNLTPEQRRLRRRRTRTSTARWVKAPSRRPGRRPDRAAGGGKRNRGAAPCPDRCRCRRAGRHRRGLLRGQEEGTVRPTRTSGWIRPPDGRRAQRQCQPEAYIANTRTVVAQNKAELAPLAHRSITPGRRPSADLDRRVSTAEQDAAQDRQTIGRLRERQHDYVQARNATIAVDWAPTRQRWMPRSPAEPADRRRWRRNSTS